MKAEKITNEYLVETYQKTGDQYILNELMKKNEGLLRLLVFDYKIPHYDIDDLLSVAYESLWRAVVNFNTTMEYRFTTYLKSCVIQALNRLYNTETRKKRFDGYAPVSYEGLIEINRDGSYFTVECGEFSAIEFEDLINRVELNTKERVIVEVLMAGGTKGDIAKILEITPATTTYHIKRLGEKLQAIY